jgi:Bacterial pre-peptidase C-terminal domain
MLQDMTLDTNGLIDQSYYLANNPDVAQAVARGLLPSALDHFQRFGQFEGRNPSAFFDTSFYLNRYSDVAAAVNAGRLTAVQHFLVFGQTERRDPTVFFDTSFYLDEYLDVATAVNNRQLTAIEHFVRYGQFEQRDPITEFYTDVYLQNNQDVARAVQSTANTANPLTGIKHFIQYGQFETRDPGSDFDNNFYLDDNPDVAAAVRPGGLSPIKHYLEFGLAEGRLGSPSYEPTNLARAENLATLSATPVTINGSVNNTEREKIYRFTINQLGQVNLNLSGLSADADLLLAEDLNGDGLLDNDADTEEQIESSDNAGTRAEAISSLLPAGTYYAIVSQYEGNTNYNLSLSATPFTTPADTAGNALGTARNLGTLTGSQTLSGFVGSSDTQDWYSFTIPNGQYLDIDLTDLSADTGLTLIRDTNGNGTVEPGETINNSNSTGRRDKSLTNRALPAGTYFVQVGEQEGETTYNLNLNATPAAPVPDAGGVGPSTTLGGAIAQAQPTFSASGTVNASTSDNFFKFTVAQSGVFTANLTGLTGDADVRLIRDWNGNGTVDPVTDRNGNIFFDDNEVEVLAWNPQRGTGNESIRRFLTSGDYFLQVTSFNKATTNYNVATNFSPADSDPLAFKFNITFADSNLNQTQQNIVLQAAKRIEQAISFSSLGKPLTLGVSVAGKQLGGSTLANAQWGNTETDANGKKIPVSGSSNINIGNQELMTDTRYLYDTMVHEFSHVLGHSFFEDNDGLGLNFGVKDSQTNRFIYRADTFVGISYGEYLRTFTPTAIPLVESPSGSRGHWLDDLFDYETNRSSGGKGDVALLSQMSIASFRDIGWNVNYGAAEDMTLRQFRNSGNS